MHCELVVPALFASRDLPRLPAVELLIARGRATHRDAGPLEDWLAEAFSIEPRPLAAGALSIHAAAEERDAAAWWARADPVHLRLEGDRPTLIPAAGFDIRQQEAQGMVASLNQHFGAEASFIALGPGQWCVQLASEAPFCGPAPVELAGQAVDAHLRGRREAAFLTEIQMVLHEHPANREREGRGEPPVNSLWLWGSGRLPASVEAPWHSVTTNDLAAAGIAKLAGVRSSGVPADANEWLERAPEEGRHLIVLEQLRAAFSLDGSQAQAARLGELEARWFAPLLGALRAGRLGMLTLHAPEAGVSWETIRGDLRRFWRRARPLGALA